MGNDLEYGNNNLSPVDEENINLLLEEVLDKIADELINSDFVDPQIVSENQKTIKNGIISLGRVNSDILVLYQKDIKANQEDLLNTIQSPHFGDINLKDIVTIFYNEGFTISQIQVNLQIIDSPDPSSDLNHIFDITLTTDSYHIFNVTNLLSDYKNNPINISQFVNVKQEKTVIDPVQANEYLDTNIWELLPGVDLRQERINNLFQEFQTLLPPNLPEFDLYDSGGNPDPDGVVDRDENQDWIGSNEYYLDYSISSTQDDVDNTNINEEEAYITRLSSNASSKNAGKTIQDIYNITLPYLTDILEEPALPLDERPEYQNKSSGYLKFRNLNQGIIIRNTNQGFIEGLNANTQDYLQTGFTITMWVRFLDRVSGGTLFNFGNPTRAEKAFGFKLETYVLDKDGNNPHDDYGTWGEGASNINQEQYFENSNTARFVRLVINDNGTLRDSHIGIDNAPKNADIPDNDGVGNEEFGLLQTTFIPEDFQEWYFICATFNNTIDEDGSFDLIGPNSEIYNQVPDFWMNHINPISGEYVVNSDYGNRCKVEIISRTDLLRSKGFNI